MKFSFKPMNRYKLQPLFVLLIFSLHSQHAGLIKEIRISVESFSVSGFELKDMPITFPADSETQLTLDDFEGILFIASVDGQGGPGLELSGRLRKLSGAAQGTRGALLDENGVDRSVVLARYY